MSSLIYKVLTPEEEEQFIQEKITKHYKKFHFSKVQKGYEIRQKYRRPCLINNTIPFSLALRVKIQKSCFGRFMKCFNEDQRNNKFLNFNKIGVEDWNIVRHTTREETDWVFENDFTEGTYDLLKKAIETEDCIDFDFIYDNLTELRLIDCQINFIDSHSVRKFKFLEKLVLSGNWIQQIDGKKLPRKLKFLECFVNEISDIRTLIKKCPSRIKHLGLARNKLTIDSGSHLLASSGNFTELHSLDLAENDITELNTVLIDLKALPKLTCLSLEGNPCYAYETYKEQVIYELPNLLYLDNTEILDEDKELDGCCMKHRENLSGLIFTCYRLIGIPSPPKAKSIVQSFHLEIEVPLMQEIKLPEPPPPPVPPVVEVVKKKGKGGKDKGKGGKDKGKGGKDKGKDGKDKKDKKEKKSKSKSKSDKASKVKLPKPAKGKGLYALPNEYDEKTYKKIKCFKTEPRDWNKIIKFNSPAITIPTPHNKVTLLRDSFRSKIKVRIMYHQIFEDKNKKKKKKPKGKKDEKPVEIEDIILKRSTFATFFCDLRSVNWSDQYIDFVWSDFPEVGKHAIAVEGSLKPEVYNEGKGGKKGKGKGKKGKEEKPPLPTKLTCHVGFGLKRCGQVQEIAKKSKGKKK